MMKTLFAKTVLIALISCSFISQGKAESILEKVKRTNIVRVGVGTKAPPMNYIDKNGAWTGFDVELANEIAKRLGVKIEKVNVNNKTRVAFLLNHRIDMTISNLSHTRSRDDVVDYAEPPYLWVAKIFYAKKGRFKSIADLGGKVIGVTQGSNAFLAAPQEIMKHSSKAPIMKSFQSNAECFLALKQGKIDAYTQDSPIIAGVAGVEGSNYEPVGVGYSPGLYGIGVPPNDSVWRDRISFVLQDMIKDGGYDAIYARWFGKHGHYPLAQDAKPRLPSDTYGKMAYAWPD